MKAFETLGARRVGNSWITPERYVITPIHGAARVGDKSRGIRPIRWKVWLRDRHWFSYAETSGEVLTIIRNHRRDQKNANDVCSNAAD